MKFTDNQQGFTLIEVVVALGVLAFGILSIMLMQVSGIKGNSTANTITTESNWAADRIEQLLNLDYPDPLNAGYANHLLSDRDADGTNQDADDNGIDDQDNGDSTLDPNENFGLDHVGTISPGACTPGAADHCAHAGLYDLFWNIAVDKPIVNTMTIKVIVIHNQGKPNRVEFEYIKADII